MRYTVPTSEEINRFHDGVSSDAYEMLGCHLSEKNGKKVWHFAVWAPNARTVSLIGEFCSWDRNAFPMKPLDRSGGIWETDVDKEQIPMIVPDKDSTYKYAVMWQDGSWHDKADPYGFCMQLRPENASVVYDPDGYEWHDSPWLRQRAKWDTYHSPMNIYEVHPGSWKRKGSGKTGNGGKGSEKGEAGIALTYLELAEQLIPYVKEMGYTHIELLPVMEHPLDMSWGYQVTGYFAVTARYGTPKEFMQFVDMCHQEGIGVILDWVPAHFPRDEIGLRRFDGTCCYENSNPLRGEMPTWGTCMFDFSKGEVRSFLLSSACYFLKYFHADGIRVDAVSAIVYHDFCRESGAWAPNSLGGRENIEGIGFLQLLNTTVQREFPGVMMIAEESHAYPGVTHKCSIGENSMPLPVVKSNALSNTNLGFTYKWNMGWMNDMLSFTALDPVYRKWHHDKLTFSLMYAFSEHFILPFSHDEVVHGKKSMVDKQPGDIWQKFAGLRALLGYTIAHPGKKLLFMGGEFGQFIEWKFDDQLDWFLLLYDRHPQLQKCVKDMNHLYLDTPALYEDDEDWNGFRWIQANDSNNSTVIFMRTDSKGKSVVCATNFTPQYIPKYRIGLPSAGTIKEIFNTDSAAYGGSDKCNTAAVKTEKIKWNEFGYSLDVALPPLATVIFTYNVRKSRAKPGGENADKVVDISPKANITSRTKARVPAVLKESDRGADAAMNPKRSSPKAKAQSASSK